MSKKITPTKLEVWNTLTKEGVSNWERSISEANEHPGKTRAIIDILNIICNDNESEKIEEILHRTDGHESAWYFFAWLRMAVVEGIEPTKRSWEWLEFAEKTPNLNRVNMDALDRWIRSGKGKRPF